MKEILLFTLMSLSLGSSLIAQEIKYQDRGVTLHHATCRLAVDGLMFDTQEHKDLIDILNEKGFVAYLPQEQGVMYSQLGRATNVFRADLVLSIKEKFDLTLDKSYLQGRLGKLEDDFFRTNNFWGEATEITGLESFNSKNLRGKGNRKALSEIYTKLPNCISYGSGHIYEEEKFYESIAKGEISRCFELYGLGTPKGTEKQELRQFFKNVGHCYSQVQSGKKCESYESNLLSGLNKKSQRVIEDYLQYAGPEEISQRIGDYLGSTKLCSDAPKKAKKMSLKTILRKMSRTL